ncbi:MAG TPA: hypothetical protein VGR34_07180 [Candidatus Dormibacteraeota bacterium]|nr:hypothetical protein [Candidatus Dormibacteraeota bacterium]
MKQVSRARWIAFYAIAALLTLLAAAEMANHIFMDTYSPHLIHSAGHLVVSALVFASIAIQLWSPRRRIAGVQQLLVLALAVAVGLALSAYFTEFVIAYLVIGLLLAALHPARASLLKLGTTASLPMGIVAVAGGVGFVAYALGQAAVQRAIGLDPVHGAHWSLMAAVTLIIPAVALLAAARTDGWRLPVYGAAAGAILLGVSSLLVRYEPSALSTMGALAALAWAVVLVAVAELPWIARRIGPKRIPSVTSNPADQVA